MAVGYRLQFTTTLACPFNGQGHPTYWQMYGVNFIYVGFSVGSA